MKPPDDGTYQIEFVTTPEGYLKTVEVTIKEGVMDMSDTARVDLCEHPLYKALQDYVRNNPR